MRACPPALALLLAACAPGHMQSAVHPAGPAAAEISWLGAVLTLVLTLVFAVTMALALVAILRRPAREGAPGEVGLRFVVMTGIVLPSIILIGIFVVSLQSTVRLRAPEGDLTVRVIGHQWWWEVIYPDLGIVTANELILPAGEAVRIELRAADVIHSFWVPNLHGKMDMFPEHTNHFWLAADAPGRWRGVCAEYCGTQHAWMAFTVEAMPRTDFESWAAGRQEPLDEPLEPVRARGRAVFVDGGCASCHPVRGISDARRGPDLTHLGSRPSLGAGVLPHTPENLRAWLRDPQRIKPGNLMPASDLADEDLDALVAWLGSLR